MKELPQHHLNRDTKYTHRQLLLSHRPRSTKSAELLFGRLETEEVPIPAAEEPLLSHAPPDIIRGEAGDDDLYDHLHLFYFPHHGEFAL